MRTIVGIIVFALGLVVLTGALWNWWQGPIGAAMMLCSGAWLQGISVREFVHRIFDEERTSRFDSIRHRKGINYKKAA